MKFSGKFSVKNVLFTLSLVLMGSIAHASIDLDQTQISHLTNDEKMSLTITSVEVYPVEKALVELPNPKAPTPPETKPAPTGTPIDEISIIIDNLIAIGKKIWPIIDAGRPVINNKLAPAVSIVPHLQSEAGVLLEMANWSMPEASSYRVSFKNGWGSEVVGFTYTLMFQYGGDYQGVGKYVTNLRVIASDIYTAWGFNFDAASELVGISNIGSSEAPVASGIINVSYAVKGLLNETRSANTIYVDGLGRTKILNQ